MNEIVLASQSPRRKEILEDLGLDITVVKPNINEIERKEDKPSSLVMSLSFQKAFNVAKENKSKLVLAADTIVVLEGNVLGKPKDEKDAYKMLKGLSGKKHEVLTGYSIINLEKKIKIINYSKTEVKFKILSEKIIKRYINTKEPMDKAGSYGIQGYGKILIEKMNGSYFNVVGLPIEKISTDLYNEFDIKII